MKYNRLALTRLESANHAAIGAIQRLFEAYGHYQRTESEQAKENLKASERYLNDVMVRISEEYSQIKDKNQ